MVETSKPNTIIQLLNKTFAFFQGKGIENPRLNAERLLCHVLDIDRIQLYLQYDRIMSKDETDHYREIILRRAQHEPIQYITGETEFMDFTIKVTPDVLIPRPETEILVEKIIDLKKSIGKQNPTIWDIGTGSGCIAISIVHYWPESHVIASDLSETALNLAKENAQLNGVENKIKFIKHNIIDDPIGSMHDVDIIVSNPPYIAETEFEQLADEIRLFEPKIALTDKSNGLQFYGKIFSLIESIHSCKFLLVELSGTQTEKITNMARNLNFHNMMVFKDLNNIPRILQLKLE